MWPSLPARSPSRRRVTSWSRNPGKQASRFGLLRFRSPLLTQCHRFLFLWVLRCFTSPRVASADYVFIRRWPPMKVAGLPHSEISGSKPVDGSPKLIAVFRVLHSLLMPRHPSCARIRLARIGGNNTALLCLMRNFSLYGGDRSPPISYMSCNSLSTSNCLLSKIEPAFARRASAR